MTCSNCGQHVREGLTACSFCGADLATGKVLFPFNDEARQVSEGAALGIFLSLLVFFVVGVLTAAHHTVIDAHYGHGVPARDTWPAWAYVALLVVPLVVNVALYFAVRRRRPQFARGLLYSVFVTLALSLGALAVCR